MTAMRPLLSALAALAVATLSGCLSGAGDAGSSDRDVGVEPALSRTSASTAMPGGAVPDNFTEHETVLPGVRTMPQVGGGPCQGRPDGCYRYTFTIETDADVAARLAWNRAVSDMDLYLYRADELRAASARDEGRTEQVAATVEPGDYTLVVSAWVVQPDTFRLTANFTEAPPDAPHETTVGDKCLRLGLVTIGSDC